MATYLENGPRYGPSTFSLMCSLLLKDLSFNFHSAYEMISWYKYLIVSFLFRPRFLEWESFTDCAFS